jgi:glyoxylase-like metal-dependent hydrolase (beta-lactamase superfamily II)
VGIPGDMILNLAKGERVFTSNVFLVTGERTVLVDPGNEFDVCAKVREHADGLDAVVLTHTHTDHVTNTPDVVSEFDVDVWGYDPDHQYVDHAIADGERVQLGDHDYTALHTPGHKNDHLCLYSAAANALIAGDLVFANGSFGRTDLEEGDRQLLVQSIERVLETVGPDLDEMHTGHGPSVTTDPAQHIDLSAEAARMG